MAEIVDDTLSRSRRRLRWWRFGYLAGFVAIGLAVLLVSRCTSAPEPVFPTERVSFPVSTPLILRDVTVVDPRDGTSTSHVSILMDKGRIVRVTATSGLGTPKGATVIDASGKFVVPGYNDMHVHVLSEPDPSGMLALMLANGITGMRQMGGSDALLKARREGRLPLGIYAPALLQTPGEILTPFNAGSIEDAEREIRKQKAEGADFIKIGLTSAPVFYAALAEARRQRIPILGHLQEGVDAARASRLGYKTVEHLGPGDPIWIKCSREESSLQVEASAVPPMSVPKIPFLEGVLVD